MILSTGRCTLDMGQRDGGMLKGFVMWSGSHRDVRWLDKEVLQFS